MIWLRALALSAALATALGCSSIQTVRVQPESVHVGEHLRPIAIVHAQVSSFYFMFIPIPGNVDLDRVVNRMLLASAKALGADKVVDIKIDITPDRGIWTLRKLLGWRSAEASGIAVVIESPPGAANGAAADQPAPASPATPKASP